MANLTQNDVLKLARLARLQLTDEEVREFQQELGEILRYVEQLQSVDISGLQPTSQVTGLTNVTRPDEEIDYGITPEELLKLVPDVHDHQIKVQRMIG